MQTEPRRASALREWALRLALLVGGLAGGAVVAELGFRVATGLPVLPLFPRLSVPRLYVPDERLGYRLQPGFSGHAYGAHVEVGEDGRRLTPPRAGEEAPLVVLLGDSGPFGFGVDQGQDLGNLLAGLGEGRYRVRNHSVPGYNSRQIVDGYLASGEPRGDLVVAFVDVNDAGREYRLGEAAGVSFLYETGVPSPLKVAVKGWVLDVSYLACFLRSGLKGRFAKGAPAPAPAEPAAPAEPVTKTHSLVFLQLGRLLDDAARRDTPVLVAPFRGRYLAALSPALEEMAAARGADLEVAIEEVEYQPLGWDSHPGPTSHAAAAARLDAWVRRRLGASPTAASSP